MTDDSFRLNKSSMQAAWGETQFIGKITMPVLTLHVMQTCDHKPWTERGRDFHRKCS